MKVEEAEKKERIKAEQKQQFPLLSPFLLSIFDSERIAKVIKKNYNLLYSVQDSLSISDSESSSKKYSIKKKKTPHNTQCSRGGIIYLM